jgi:hypothetical protein
MATCITDQKQKRCQQNVWCTGNSRGNYGVKVEHDNLGRVRQVGNVFINYDANDRVKRIGSVYMTYNRYALERRWFRNHLQPSWSNC